MNRRNFMKNSSLSALALSCSPAFASSLLKNAGSVNYFSIPVAAQQHVRHGALSLPMIDGVNIDHAFKQILQVDRNIFLKNDIHYKADDPEIISFFIQENSPENLQVLLDQQGVSCLYKGQYFYQVIDVESKQWSRVVAEKLPGTLVYGTLNAEDAFEKTFETERNIYFLPLDGKLTLNDVDIDPNISLGIENSQILKIQATENARFLMLIFD